MRKRLLILLLLFTVMLGIPVHARQAERGNAYKGFISVKDGILIDETGKEYIIYGINTTDNWTKVFSPEAHSAENYHDIASYNMNTVRICLNASKFETVNPDGTVTLSREALDMLKESIDNATAEGIRCIIDMHNPPGGFQGFTDGLLLEDASLQKRFIDLWKFIAEAFKDNPYVLAYGLCNEPVGPLMGSADNAISHYSKFIQRTIDAIRAIDSKHILIVAPINGTYDEKVAGPVERSRVTWWSILNTPLPKVTDPKGNIMIGYNYYKSSSSGYGHEFVSATINKSNIADQRTVWYDKWHTMGMQTGDVMPHEGYTKPPETNASLASLKGNICQISASYKYTLDYDTSVYYPKLDVIFDDSDMVVYIDNLRMVKHYTDGTSEELFFGDFNDTRGYAALGFVPGTLDYVADSPFNAGDKLLALTSGGKSEIHFPLFNSVVVEKGEAVEITADAIAVSSTARPSNSVYDLNYAVRFKAQLYLIDILSPSLPPYVLDKTAPFLASKINWGDVQSLYTWQDSWHNRGIKKSDVNVLGNTPPGSIKPVDGAWKTVTANISIIPVEGSNPDAAVINPKLNIWFADSNDIVYVDNIKIVRTNAQNQTEVLHLEDFVEMSDYRSLDFNATVVAGLVTDNPFDPNDKLLKVTNPDGKEQTNIPVFNNIILKAGETLTVSAEVFAIADSKKINGNYARMKTEITTYTAIDKTKPLVIGNSRGLVEFNLLRMREVCQAAGWPLYVSELGASWSFVSNDPYYESWFRDVASVIGEHRLSFTWHAQVGASHGLYFERGNKNQVIDSMFQKYFVNNEY